MSNLWQIQKFELYPCGSTVDLPPSCKQAYANHSQSSHSATNFKSLRSVSRSSEVICPRTLSSAATRA